MAPGIAQTEPADQENRQDEVGTTPKADEPGKIEERKTDKKDKSVNFESQTVEIGEKPLLKPNKGYLHLYAFALGVGVW